MRYLKEHWPHLLLTLLGSAASSAFVLGFAWAMLGSRLASAERRLDEIDGAHVAETRWQVQQDEVAVGVIRSDARRTEAEIAQINTRLGVIEAKLDAIAETLRRRP
jgi:hypothetical protein